MNKNKLYYPIEEAINNVSAKLHLGLKDANEMNEAEIFEAEEEISKHVDFVEHTDYIQLVPKIKETGELIL
jgi:hypothetical protein